MTAERQEKIFERMVITAKRLKKISNGRPERLNGSSKILNGWSWTAEQLVKIFKRMVITAERLKIFRTVALNNWTVLVKFQTDGHAQEKGLSWLAANGTSGLNVRTAHVMAIIIYKLFQTDLLKLALNGTDQKLMFITFATQTAC